MLSTQKYIITLGNYDVPSGWPMKPYKRPYGGTPGPPVMYEKPSDPEEEGAGYGYSNGMSQQERDVFYYHSDHLGSTSYITDANGEATQFVCYKPYGESLIDEHATSFEQPWKFNGKELDAETGLYYYGARYYEPVLAIFYGTDRYTEKFPWQSAYSYAGGNPIGNIEVRGNSIYFCLYAQSGHGSYSFEAGAQTRKNDIENSHGFDRNKDIVIVAGFDDISDICNIIQNSIEKYSDKYGHTQEVGIWAHSGFDGPCGSLLVSQYPLGGPQGSSKQMSLEGWSSIDFNWVSSGAEMRFYGCNTANDIRSDGGYGSFARNISLCKNMRNVNIWGQPTSAYPSNSPYYRTTTLMRTVFGKSMFNPTYFVGNTKGGGFEALTSGRTINRMKMYRNGYFITSGFQK